MFYPIYGLVRRCVPVLLLCRSSTLSSLGQTVIPDLDPQEKPGERPYEMVWAKRVESAPPTLRFDRLAGWKMQVEAGAEGNLQVTRCQNVWDRAVARLQYHGDGKRESKPRIIITPPEPVAVPEAADSVDLWAYGNRWGWENPPGTPPVTLLLHLRDGSGKIGDLMLDNVRWQEWWLVHKRLPKPLQPPALLDSIEIAGGWQPEWRELYFDSIHFYRETVTPLQFAGRPQRNLTLFQGQSAGANTGPGKLPFPTREETILPMHLSGKFTNSVESPGQLPELIYRDADHTIAYHVVWLPRDQSGLLEVRAEVDGQAVGSLLSGATIHGLSPTNWSSLGQIQYNPDQSFTVSSPGGTTLRFQIWQKSLVMDVSNETGKATELAFGEISGVTEPRTIWVPYLTYGGGVHPCVLVSKAGTNHVFTSLWLDWYRSNGSEPYAAESVSTNRARINGGVRYLPRTDGQRNPLFERIFLTVSPTFEEVLPTVPNPLGLHAAEATDRLWQESWGPDDFEKQMKRSRMLRAYGIEKLIQCNHEIAWRDGGESFTLRLRAAPKKGGDEALGRYVAHQRSLGWLAGLYSNYTDYAPVNEFWSPDGVQLQPDGNWRSAWPRCYAEKPLKAVEFDALLAPQIKAKYNPNSAYTDVHTAVSPWGYNDYDARVPGAGTFAQTFYAYGEILRNDSSVYGGPIFSEGTYHWLYAGLADGNYALAYDGRPLAKEPLLPVFDLYQIHTRECDIGMGWTANFCDAIPDWRKPGNLDRAIDRFLLHTLAYGHIGWLVEEEHGLDRTCRSYYMLQQVQARYGLKAPVRVAYWDGSKLLTVSEALMQDLPRTRRQLFVEYPGDLCLWLNDHPAENWTIATSDPGPKPSDFGFRFSDLVLPPSGWAATTRDRQLLAYSGLNGTNRIDYIRSPAYTYLDGRGHWFDAPEVASDGAIVLRPLQQDQLEVIRISGSGPFLVRRSYAVQGAMVECQAADLEGRQLTSPVFHDSAGETRIEPVDKAIRYVLRFESKGP